MAEEFVTQGGLSLLEAVQYNSEGEIRQRATHLLEYHLLSYSSYCSVKILVQFVLLKLCWFRILKTRLISCVVLQVDNSTCSWTNGKASNCHETLRSHLRRQAFLFTFCNLYKSDKQWQSIFDTFLNMIRCFDVHHLQCCYQWHFNIQYVKMKYFFNTWDSAPRVSPSFTNLWHAFSVCLLHIVPPSLQRLKTVVFFNPSPSSETGTPTLCTQDGFIWDDCKYLERGRYKSTQFLSCIYINDCTWIKWIINE